MNIIQSNASETGSRPPVQSWSGATPPNGYAVVAPECDTRAMQSHAGFVDLTVEDGVVTAIKGNDEAYQAYLESIAPDAEAALAEAKDRRIQQSKDDLEAYLEAHPLTWTDGNQYSITREKQNQLMGTIAAAQIDGQPPEWNTTGGVCRAWDLAELCALAVAIKDRVKALVKYQQAKEVAMREAQTMEELEAVVVDYDTVQ